MFLLICFMLVLCPLMLGSARDVLIWFWLPYIGLMGLFTALARDRVTPLIRWPLVPMAAFLLIPLIEMTRPFWGGALNDLHPFGQFIPQWAEFQLPPLLNPFQSLKVSMILVGHLVFFWVCVNAFSRKARRPDNFLHIFACMTAFFAIYGIVADYFYADHVLWFSFPDTTPGVRSTFVNRNNFATFAGLGSLCSVTWLHALLARPPDRAGEYAEQQDHRFFANLQGAHLLAMFCVVSNVSGLMLSGSRAGIILTFFALCVLLLVLSRSGKSRLFYGFIAVMLLLVVVISSQLFLTRLELGADSLGHRLVLFNIMARAAESNLMTGIGLGNTEEVIRLMTDVSLYSWYFRRGHNDLMELLLGGGLICLMLALLCLVSVLANLWRNLSASQNGHAALAFCAIILVTAHSLVDFPFQIPGVSFSLTAIVALGFATSSKQHRDGA